MFWPIIFSVSCRFFLRFCFVCDFSRGWMDDEWMTWKAICLIDVVTWVLVMAVDVWRQQEAGLCSGRMAAVAAMFLLRWKKNEKMKEQK